MQRHTSTSSHSQVSKKLAEQPPEVAVGGVGDHAGATVWAARCPAHSLSRQTRDIVPVQGGHIPRVDAPWCLRRLKLSVRVAIQAPEERSGWRRKPTAHPVRANQEGRPSRTPVLYELLLMGGRIGEHPVGAVQKHLEHFWDREVAMRLRE